MLCCTVLHDELHGNAIRRSLDRAFLDHAAQPDCHARLGFLGRNVGRGVEITCLILQRIGRQKTRTDQRDQRQQYQGQPLMLRLHFRLPN